MTVLLVVIALAAVAAGGWVGYRIGYRDGEVDTLADSWGLNERARRAREIEREQQAPYAA